jgi:hypothetical protein
VSRRALLQAQRSAGLDRDRALSGAGFEAVGLGFLRLLQNNRPIALGSGTGSVAVQLPGRGDSSRKATWISR